MKYIEKLTPSQKERIHEFELAAQSGSKIKGENVIKFLEELFNPTGIYEEAYVPASFLTSHFGNILLEALYKSDYNEDLTVADICEELNVSKQYINKCIKNGKLQGKLKGGVWWIKRSEVEKFKHTIKKK